MLGTGSEPQPLSAPCHGLPNLNQQLEPESQPEAQSALVPGSASDSVLDVQRVEIYLKQEEGERVETLIKKEQDEMEGMCDDGY